MKQNSIWFHPFASSITLITVNFVKYKTIIPFLYCNRIRDGYYNLVFFHLYIYNGVILFYLSIEIKETRLQEKQFMTIGYWINRIMFHGLNHLLGRVSVEEDDAISDFFSSRNDVFLIIWWRVIFVWCIDTNNHDVYIVIRK